MRRRGASHPTTFISTDSMNASVSASASCRLASIRWGRPCQGYTRRVQAVIATVVASLPAGVS